MPKDLYSILELERNADSNDIRKQYIKLSRQYHPDKVSDDQKEEATAKFKEISGAYEVLSDANAKAFYDQTGSIPGEQGGPPPGGPGGPGGFPMPFPFDINNLFGMFGGGGGMRGGGGPNRGRPVRQHGKAPPRKKEIPMTLKDFYFGRTLYIHLERDRFCQTCDGDGSKNKRACDACQGSGVRASIVQMGPMIMQTNGPCGNCEGTGRTRGDPCGGCNGSKFIKQDKTLELIVQKGMKPGDTIVFSGESSQQEDYTGPGDVVIELVSADEDSDWERQGDNLKTRIGITLGEALCGKVIRLDGHPAHENGLFIQIPQGVQNRQEIVVEGCGMPRSIGTGFGDAILLISVVATKEERVILEEKKETLQSLFQISKDNLTNEATLVWQANMLSY
jgi:DnaJ family protein A protein 2